MQERYLLTNRQINDDLTRPVLTTPFWFWVAAALLGGGLSLGLLVVAVFVIFGLGVTGLNRPVFWGVMITNFVFWVGISHAGVMISSILRLSQAEWRRPVTRAAEVLTIFALGTAMTFPLIHTGRPWRTLYWVFPYDFFRAIWPNVRSPLVWDPSAIFTYLTSASLFVYVALLPDLAVLRERTTGLPHLFYSIASLGWRGTPRQWYLQALAGILLSALILPVFVSVHSIVSWDFAVSLVPNWHATIFAPYFVIGAVWSGVSAVATLMVIMRSVFKWQKYITPDHFDAIGRLLLVVGVGWFYFFVLEYLFGFYGAEPAEIAVREFQLFSWPWNLLFAIFMLAAFLIPVPMLCFRGIRRSIKWMLITSLLVNVGMWLERYIIIVPGLAYKQVLTFSYGEYTPSIFEFTLIFASFCMVGLGILVFSKVFPLMPIGEAKEGQIFRASVKVGKVEVPAVIRE